jgi:hypothetical protein
MNNSSADAEPSFLCEVRPLVRALSDVGIPIARTPKSWWLNFVRFDAVSDRAVRVTGKGHHSTVSVMIAAEAATGSLAVNHRETTDLLGAIAAERLLEPDDHRLVALGYQPGSDRQRAVLVADGTVVEGLAASSVSEPLAVPAAPPDHAVVSRASLIDAVPRRLGAHGDARWSSPSLRLAIHQGCVIVSARDRVRRDVTVLDAVTADLPEGGAQVELPASVIARVVHRFTEANRVSIGWEQSDDRAVLSLRCGESTAVFNDLRTAWEVGTSEPVARVIVKASDLSQQLRILAVTQPADAHGRTVGLHPQGDSLWILFQGNDLPLPGRVIDAEVIAGDREVPWIYALLEQLEDAARRLRGKRIALEFRDGPLRIADADRDPHAVGSRYIELIHPQATASA